MKTLTTILLCIMLMGCASTSLNSSNPLDVDNTELTETSRVYHLFKLRKHRNIWKNNDLKNYHYTITSDCPMCPPGPFIGPNQLIFQDGVLISEIYRGDTQVDYGTGEPYVNGQDISGRNPLNDSIQDLFDLIEKLLKEKPESAERSQSIENIYFDVEYNDKWGIPTKIYHTDMRVMDGVTSLKIEDFEIR